MKVSFSGIAKFQTHSPRNPWYTRKAVLDVLNRKDAADKLYTKNDQESIRELVKSYIPDYCPPKTKNEKIGSTPYGVLPFSIENRSYLCTGEDIVIVNNLIEHAREHGYKRKNTEALLDAYKNKYCEKEKIFIINAEAYKNSNRPEYFYVIGKPKNQNAYLQAGLLI